MNPNSTRHPVAHPVHLHGHHYSVLSTGCDKSEVVEYYSIKLNSVVLDRGKQPHRPHHRTRPRFRPTVLGPGAKPAWDNSSKPRPPPTQRLNADKSWTLHSNQVTLQKKSFTCMKRGHFFLKMILIGSDSDSDRF